MKPRMYETIASPIEYGGIRLKNRIIFAPTTMGLKQEDYCEKSVKSPRVDVLW